jgi:serine/threonine protein kinase/tetratricopeptide (TPR) repeat protein
MGEYKQENPPPNAARDQCPDVEVTPERWKQIKELFGATLEREPGERRVFLQDACGADESLRAEVESLLAEEQNVVTGSVKEEVYVSPPVAEPAEDLMIGRRLGAYEICRKIGYGGMAAVYLAVRADDQYRKRVAIKLVIPGLDNQEILRRFRTERQTLASLDHPNIVKLLDGGTTEEGLPFLVMDYVEGIPIDEYCDRHNRPTRERLQLFCSVCAAVQHAHERQVIHRDLKPSNILVTADERPKLLDFGIAKVLNPDIAARTVHFTQAGMRVLTPAYASPEQVRGEPVTPASDVYALGVVLYELLTGHHPYRLRRRTPLEIERAICETDPEKPSTVVSRVETQRRLRGDLDNIVLTSLHKEPKRRYASVEEFSTDIERHLKHLPVKARKSTLAYRSSKFVRRHKVEVAAAAIVLLLFISGIFFVSWEGRHAAERARSEWHGTQLNARRSVAVLGFKNLSGRPDVAWLSTALSQMLTTELGAGEKLRTIPGENVAQMKINLALPDAETLAPETLARVRKNLGTDLVLLGSYLDMGKEAGGQIRLDLRLQDAARGETIAEVAENGTEVALFNLVTRAGTHLREKLGLEQVSPSQAVTVSAALPSNLRAARLYSEGLEKLRVFDALAARALLEKAVGDDPSHALAHSALAEAWSALGYDAKSVDEAMKAFDLSTSLSREQRLWVEGRYRQATKEWEKAIGIYQTLFNFFPDNLEYGLRLVATQTSAGKGKDGLATSEVLRKLPSPIGDDPRIDLAEADAAGSLSDFKRQASAASQAAQKGAAEGARLMVARARVAEGLALRGLGDGKGANAASYEARRLFAAAGDRNGEARALHNIGAVFFDQSDLVNAKKAFEQSMLIRHQLGNKAGEASELNNIAVVLAHQKNLDSATHAYEQALALAREMGDRRNIGIMLNNIALLERDQGKSSYAKKHFQEALAIDREVGNQSEIARVLSNVAIMLTAEGDLPRARRMLEECLEISRRIGEKNEIGTALANLGDVQSELGELGSAQRLYSEALQLFTLTGNQSFASYALFGLGGILVLEGDFTAARKKHEEALAIREKAGEKGDISASRLSLADLLLEEGNASEAEAAAREASKELRAQEAADDEARAESVLARSLLMQNKLSDAQAAIAHARKLVAQSHNRNARIYVAITDARVRAASGKTAEAVKLLTQSLHQAQEAGFVGLQLEALLALGETELRAGNLIAGRTRLKALERDATRKGFVLIARKAAATIAET